MKPACSNSLELVEERLFERRKFSYSNHIPERRSGRDRRKDARHEHRWEGAPRFFVVRPPEK
jgi:hypothetical protein